MFGLSSDEDRWTLSDENGSAVSLSHAAKNYCLAIIIIMAMFEIKIMEYTWWQTKITFGGGTRILSHYTGYKQPDIIKCIKINRNEFTRMSGDDDIKEDIAV